MLEPDFEILTLPIYYVITATIKLLCFEHVFNYI